MSVRKPLQPVPELLEDQENITPHNIYSPGKPSGDREFRCSESYKISQNTKEINGIRIIDLLSKLEKAENKIKQLSASNDKERRFIISRLMLLEGKLIKDKKAVDELLYSKNRRIRELELKCTELEKENRDLRDASEYQDSAIGSLDSLAATNLLMKSDSQTHVIRRNVTDPDQVAVETALGNKCRRTNTDPGNCSRNKNKGLEYSDNSLIGLNIRRDQSSPSQWDDADKIAANQTKNHLKQNALRDPSIKQRLISPNTYHQGGSVDVPSRCSVPIGHERSSASRQSELPRSEARSHTQTELHHQLEQAFGLLTEDGASSYKIGQKPQRPQSLTSLRTRASRQRESERYAESPSPVSSPAGGDFPMEYDAAYGSLPRSLSNQRAGNIQQKTKVFLRSYSTPNDINFPEDVKTTEDEEVDDILSSLYSSNSLEKTRKNKPWMLKDSPSSDTSPSKNSQAIYF